MYCTYNNYLKRYVLYNTTNIFHLRYNPDTYICIVQYNTGGERGEREFRNAA